MRLICGLFLAMAFFGIGCEGSSPSDPVVTEVEARDKYRAAVRFQASKIKVGDQEEQDGSFSVVLQEPSAEDTDTIVLVVDGSGNALYRSLSRLSWRANIGLDATGEEYCKLSKASADTEDTTDDNKAGNWLYPFAAIARLSSDGSAKSSLTGTRINDKSFKVSKLTKGEDGSLQSLELSSDDEKVVLSGFGQGTLLADAYTLVVYTGIVETVGKEGYCEEASKEEAAPADGDQPDPATPGATVEGQQGGDQPAGTDDQQVEGNDGGDQPAGTDDQQVEGDTTTA